MTKKDPFKVPTKTVNLWKANARALKRDLRVLSQLHTEALDMVKEAGQQIAGGGGLYGNLDTLKRGDRLLAAFVEISEWMRSRLEKEIKRIDVCSGEREWLK